MTRGNHRLARIGFRVLLTLTVLWGTVAAAVVFAIRFDLFPHRTAPEIPSPGESVRDLELQPLAADRVALRLDRLAGNVAIVFFDPADAGSETLLRHFSRTTPPDADTSTHAVALFVTGSVSLLGGLRSAIDPPAYFRVDSRITQRIRYYPSAWLVRDGAVQAVVEGFGGSEALLAAVDEFLRAGDGGPCWRRLAGDAWGTIIPPDSTLQMASRLPGVRDVFGFADALPAGLMSRVTLVWKSLDSTAGWQVDLARPNCNCPFDQVDHWDYARVVMDPVTGHLLDLVLRRALTTAELRTYMPM